MKFIIYEANGVFASSFLGLLLADVAAVAPTVSGAVVHGVVIDMKLNFIYGIDIDINVWAMKNYVQMNGNCAMGVLMRDFWIVRD